LRKPAKRPPELGIDFAATAAAVEAALRQVKTPASLKAKHAADQLTWHAAIPGMGRDVVHAFLGPARTPPQDRAVSAAETKKQLMQVQKRVAALLETLDTMNKPAILALNLEYKALRSLKMNLRILGVSAANPIPEDLRTKLPKTDRGRKPEARPARVARKLARYFYILTREPPTQYKDGPFCALVEDVFTVLGMSDNAEHYANKAADGFAEEIRLKPV
jgi:hypothetical protein